MEQSVVIDYVCSDYMACTKNSTECAVTTGAMLGFVAIIFGRMIWYRDNLGE